MRVHRDSLQSIYTFTEADLFLLQDQSTLTTASTWITVDNNLRAAAVITVSPVPLNDSLQYLSHRYIFVPSPHTRCVLYSQLRIQNVREI
jgi:hypothetical protein